MPKSEFRCILIFEKLNLQFMIIEKLMGRNRKIHSRILKRVFNFEDLEFKILLWRRLSVKSHPFAHQLTTEFSGLSVRYLFYREKAR